MARTPKYWDRTGPIATALSPLSVLFGFAVSLRRLAYARGWLASERLAVPVIVVGNITAGGTGKTPLTIWLAHRLAQAGYRPGIVTRGYGGASRATVQVHPDSDPREVGDEAVLLARRSGCPVWRGARRAEAARCLLTARPERDCILSDDGLQHYALARDVEIAVIDGSRGFGNALPLPAGPLREPVARLQSVDAIVVNGPPAKGLPAGHAMHLAGDRAINMQARHRGVRLAEWAGKPVHAVAGIGHPGRFFAALEGAGLAVAAHAFADHHRFRPADLAFADDRPVIMTEKDAVKCFAFAQPNWWYVPVDADVAASLWPVIAERLPRPGTPPRGPG